MVQGSGATHHSCGPLRDNLGHRGAATALLRAPHLVGLTLTCLALLAVRAVPAGALPAGTRIETSDDGKIVQIPGEPLPQPGAKLPVPKVKRTAADKPIATKAPEAAKPVAGPREVETIAQPAVEFGGGYIVLPDSVLRLIATARNPGKGQRDQHPTLQGLVIEGGYRMPVSPRSWIVVRGGLILPMVPDQNWWAAKGSPAPLYTAISVVGIDITADYLRRFEVNAVLGVLLRGGLGLQVVAGGATQTETLPNCAASKAATCATWRTLGKTEVWLPPVLPALRATAGLDLRLSKELALQVEGGLRSAPYLGGGFAYSF